MTSRFHLGFKSLEQKIQLKDLPTEGEIPDWLSGSLIVNGPGKFKVGDQAHDHWFDGLAMLRRFTFKNGQVSYANKFLQSRGFKRAMQSGKIDLEQFATYTRPSFFQRLSFVFSSPKFPDNTNTNLTLLDGRFLAVTETPTAIEFDPQTLSTVGVFDYEDRLPGMITTAHPHYDAVNKAFFNYTLDFSLISRYNVYYVQPGSKRRTRIVSIPVKTPSYMHSFGMTENFIILTEFPLVVNPLRFLWGGRPFIENYRWKPERGTRFLVIDKREEKVVGIYESESFFAFHHINAFEQDDQIVLDICAYLDATIIDELYLNRLREAGREHIPKLEFRRYRIPVKGSTVTYDVIFDEPFELPRINYARYNTKAYRFAYGVGQNKKHLFDFVNQLVKVEIQERTGKTWFEEDCYPGEPVFVPAPEARTEDDGVILSVVLDVNKGHSFLLILDAKTFSEVARAQMPHHIPFGFHGQFFSGV